MSRFFALTALVIGCSNTETGEPNSVASSNGGAGGHSSTSRGGAIGDEVRPSGGAPGTSSGAAAGGGSVGWAGAVANAGGGNGGGPAGQRCDYVKECVKVPGPCSAGLGSPCGGCSMGTFHCGPVHGFYSSDGASFACTDSDAGGECDSAAVSDASAHCAACLGGDK